MNPQIAIRVLILAASAMSPLVSFKIAHMVALIATKVFDAILGGKPLPPLSDVVLVKFAGSNVSVGIGLALTIFILISVVTSAKSERPGNDSPRNMPLFLAFIEPFVSAIYLAIILLATLLPLTPMGHVLTQSAAQDAGPAGR